MAAESSRSSASADSYIGSLISLTSKSEMRYEGVLYNINTDESSIGLRNVRSFGTEGRKKDGPQVPPSDKIYEYILFRGSDIKDLQVKSSPPAQTSPPINNDPAIIQSHYPRPPTCASFPSTVSGSPSDLSSHTAQSGHPGASFQGGLPLYQPSANIGPWGLSPPPPAAGGGGLPMPMYWQGYNFPPPNGLPQLPQQSLLRPPPGLSMPPLQQPIQYPGFNPSLPIGTPNLPVANLPENPSLLSSTTGSLNLAPTPSPALTSQSNLPPVPSITLAPESVQSSIPNKPSIPILSTPPLSANLPAVFSLTVSSTDANPVVPPTSNKSNTTSISTFSYPILSQPISSVVGGSKASPLETSAPSLVTPGQLLHSSSAAVSAPQPPQTAQKDVEVVKVSSPSLEPSAPVAVEAQPPLLPLPQPSRAAHKPNGAPFQGRPAYGGRERGGGAGFSRPVMKFTEDFDFTAMNEKFNKDEVWGHLGKSNRSHKEVDEGSDEDDYEDEYYSEAAKIEVKPVYNKDDFFDSISSNALDRESNSGRIRFSEQRKIDTETFGDFSRYHGGRGGHWHGRGGRYRGSYRGRGYSGGYSGRGGGYSGSGGRNISNRDF